MKSHQIKIDGSVDHHAMPYWRLSGFYFFYFGALGIIVPYWGLYLQTLGFGPAEIGELIAVIMATKIIAPNLWGWIADHTGRRMAIVRLASLLALVAFAGVFLTRDFWLLAVVMTLFSFFWNASLPQFEAVTFNYLGSRIHRYAHIRLWGSIGFILTVVVLGKALDRFGTELVPQAVLLSFLGIWLASLLIGEKEGSAQHEHQPSLVSVLKRPEILAFLTVCLLMQAGHGTYYAFYSIYMKEHGYSSGMIGWLWAAGVTAEVLVFLGMHRLLYRFGAGRVLLASLLLAALRWLLTGGLPGFPVLMLLAQTLHAATFGTFHAAAIHLVHHYFTGRHQGRGQALYSSLSFGAGGAIGSLSSGYLWSGIGPEMTFFVSAGVAALAALVAWRWIDHRY